MINLESKYDLAGSTSIYFQALNSQLDYDPKKARKCYTSKAFNMFNYTGDIKRWEDRILHYGVSDFSTGISSKLGARQEYELADSILSVIEFILPPKVDKTKLLLLFMASDKSKYIADDVKEVYGLLDFLQRKIQQNWDARIIKVCREPSKTTELYYFTEYKCDIMDALTLEPLGLNP